MSLPAIDGQTKLIGIFGDPVAHTFSPAMHNAAFEHLGLNYRYVPFHVKPENIKQAVEAIRVLNLVGVNVTVPHKVAVYNYLIDNYELGDVARGCGAVNTIVNKNGKLIGRNTDGYGFYRALAEKLVEITGKSPEEATNSLWKMKYLILGAGGAARAAIALLCVFKVPEVFIFNRTLGKAQYFVDDLRINPNYNKTDLQVLSSKSDLKAASDRCDVIVNCTSLGLHDGDPLPIPSALIKPDHIVFDMVYHLEQTELLKKAVQRRAETISGLEMLLHQGVEAFKFWTGIEEPPVEVMRAALYEKLGIKK